MVLKGLKRPSVFDERLASLAVEQYCTIANELSVMGSCTVWGHMTAKQNLTVSGDLTANGDFTFGDAITDELTVTGKADFNGAQEWEYDAVTVAGVTTAADDFMIGIKYATGVVANENCTVTLSTEYAESGRIFIVKDLTGLAATTTNTIIVYPEGGATLIDGGASTTVLSAYGVLRVFSDGASWWTW